MFLEQAFSQNVDLSQPLKVLDLCAAPGGKSTHLLSMLPEGSVLVTNEVIRSRVPVLSMNMAKWGYPNVIITNNDPAEFGKIKGYFDVILTDAPCSGEGLFRKDPDAIKEWSPDQVNLCSSRQRRILEDVWPSLKKDGILIYSTCTFNEEENEKNLKRFLQNHKGISVSINISDLTGVVCSDYNGIKGYRFYPNLLKGEGFFLSVIKKISEETYEPGRTSRKKSNPVNSPALPNLLKQQKEFNFKEKNGTLIALPKIVSDSLEEISSQLNIYQAGVAIGELKHGKLIPDHALALSNELKRGAFPECELSEMDALKFLRKDTFQPEGSGITLFTYQGFGIGWGNILSNRVNNFLPNSWRILK